MTQPTLFDDDLPRKPRRRRVPSTVIEQRDDAMARVAQKAGDGFAAAAETFVVTFLSRHIEAHGERITDACKAAGIVPHDDRAFGPVYMRLARQGRICKVRQEPRRKGHGTSGGNVWRIAIDAVRGQ
jgi:hypothetical protein